MQTLKPIDERFYIASLPETEVNALHDDIEKLKDTIKKAEEALQKAVEAKLEKERENKQRQDEVKELKIKLQREEEAKLEEERQKQRRCHHCFDDSLTLQDGVECTNGHFFCDKCFSTHILETFNEDLQVIRARQGKVYCPGICTRDGQICSLEYDIKVIYAHGSYEAIEKYRQINQLLQLAPDQVKDPPENGAVFVQAIGGTVYLMPPQERRNGVHSRILARMPHGEEAASAGFIESTGMIVQISGVVNAQNLFNVRNLNEHGVLGPVFAERVKLHYDLGDVKWVL